MPDIKVLGPGCANCAKVAEIAHHVAGRLAVAATITKVTDRAAWKQYGLMCTPGLVVNEKLVCAGRIPSEAEVTTWITNELAAA